MNISRKGLLIVLVLVSALGLAACKQEGQAEKAGKKIDQAVDQAGKKIDQATNEASKKMEQAGDTVSDKSEQAVEYVDDAAITAKVKAEIASDPLLKVSQISVTTTKGIVRLSGVVDSQQSIDRALEITRKIKGVQITENKLVTKSAN
ncbi:MAG: BON domain-containing protein [Desulfobulbus sp.]|nr:BON domain-containing protein [Desulfobulbus sp.]